MLKISSIPFHNSKLQFANKVFTNSQASSYSSNIDVLSSIPYVRPINFSMPNFKARIVEDIDEKSYAELSEEDKQICREKYNNFYKLVKISELYRPNNRNINSKLPLSFESEMDSFLNVSKVYNQYKDNRIICVGRSPKWFLNASIWMKDGIKGYDYLAFSSNWYSRNRHGLGMNQILSESKVPTPEQKEAYKKYLEGKKCTPRDYVNTFKETGKKIIVTDYIHSGCGLASFLDLMAQFAKEDGILEEFANSIKVVTLSSMEYFDDLGMVNSYAVPTAIMPDILKPFNVEQEYQDMPADVMRGILIDKNTNECRSTYFPPAAWTVYDPTKYGTGFIPDDVLHTMPKKFLKRKTSSYTDAMKDYRNLMNFRILDALASRGMLKEEFLKK